MADSVQIELELKGAKIIEKMLIGIGADMKDLDDAMGEVGDMAIGIFKGQVFASRGQFIGQSWPRLSDRYAAWKAKKFAGRPPLIRQGGMKGSFYKKTDQTSVTIGNKAHYFKYHQSSEKRSRLPRRAMIGVYTGMQDDVTRVIALALAKKIKARAR